MSFRFNQGYEDAHMMAETCKVFAETLSPQERMDFYSALIPELLDYRKAVDCPPTAYPQAPSGYEPVTEIVREMYLGRPY